MTYKATLDNLVKIVTVFSTIAFAVVIVVILWQSKENIDVSQFVIIGVLLFSCFISYGLSPRDYSITNENLIVNRLFSNKEIKLSNIQKIQVLNNNEIKWAIRIFGVGGLFGYFGKFWNSSFGSMTWYSTKRNNAVLIETSTKKIVITPDEQDKFISELKSKISLSSLSSVNA